MKRARRSVILLALAATGVTAGPATAGAVSIKLYRKFRHEQRTMSIRPVQLLRMRMIGSYEGLSWANILNKRAGVRPIFCPPGSMRPTADLVMGIVDAELARDAAGPRRYRPNQPVELILIIALRRKWPCR